MSIGKIKFNVTANGFQKEIDWDTLPEASQRRLAQASTRTMNDYVNGAAAAARVAKDATPETIKAAIDEAVSDWWAKLESGDWSATRGGGARLSPLAKEIRLILTQLLVGMGSKQADAESDAKDPDHAIGLIVKVKAKVNGRGDLDTMAEEFLSVITKEAQRRVDLAQGFSL